VYILQTVLELVDLRGSFMLGPTIFKIMRELVEEASIGICTFLFVHEIVDEIFNIIGHLPGLVPPILN
jgi:hypothetical protein